jgi:hypothetical protein
MIPVCVIDDAFHAVGRRVPASVFGVRAEEAFIL